jgi:hypothetical protein
LGETSRVARNLRCELKRALEDRVLARPRSSSRGLSERLFKLSALAAQLEVASCDLKIQSCCPALCVL